MSEPTKINVADYTKFPGGRYSEDGHGNGTDFRTRYLVPAFNTGNKVIINLDGGVLGYPSGFLEESFGGLVRIESMDKNKVLEKLEFESDDTQLLADVTKRVTSYITYAQVGDY